MTLAEIDLSDTVFWGLPLADRAAAFALLRAQPRPQFYEEPDVPFSEKGPGYYALVRHADVVEASRRADVFCSGNGATSIVDLPAEFNEYFGSMINMDDPRHARLRRIVSRAFSPRMVASFQDNAQRVAATIVDDLLATGPCDFVSQVAARLPLKIICDMMGIPDDQFEMVLANTNIILSGADPEFLSEDLDEAVAQLLGSGQALADLVTSLAAARAQWPGDDLVSALVTANIDGEQLTSAELASFFILLVVAGNETTRTALSHALMLLTEYPDQRALLLADLENRVEGAVEEIVRYASPVLFMRRTLTRDYAMNGQDYRAGDKVVLFYYSADRDEAVFADPDRFDITRSPNPHVGFGAAGPHYCLGAHLARRELKVMLRELLTRVPDITAGEPDRLLSSFINGIKRLPCQF
ncbi:MAG TPA: cytochrome P450 [Streptosporangiaceae bacterium]|nr:cytochrome P450 [Streptosporangiaceae bacterium]